MLTLSVAACVPLRPQVELAKGVSLASYTVFEVGPVVDQSHYPFFPWPIEDSLRLRLTRRLVEHGLTVRVSEANVADSSPGVLVLRSTLTFFRGGDINPRVPETRISSRCQLVTDLFDKQSGARVGDVVAAEDATYMPFQVLMTCARLVGDELARRVRAK